MLASAADFFSRAQVICGEDTPVYSEIIDLGEGRPLAGEPLGYELTLGGGWSGPIEDVHYAKLQVYLQTFGTREFPAEGTSVDSDQFKPHELVGGRSQQVLISPAVVRGMLKRYLRLQYWLSPDVTVRLTARLTSGTQGMAASVYS